MMLLAAALGELLHACAPNIGSRTMTAIVRVESGGRPNIIHDNTARRSYSPRDADQAAAWTTALLAERHSVDLGLSQINSANLPALGVSVREAFDPCINLHAGATILASDYRAASHRFGAGQFALRRAIGAYNSGSLFSGYAYIQEILAAAGVSAQDDFRVPDLERTVFAGAPPLEPASVRADLGPSRADAVRAPLLAGVKTSAAGGSPASSPILVTNGVAASGTAPTGPGSPANAAPAAAAPDAGAGVQAASAGSPDAVRPSRESRASRAARAASSALTPIELPPAQPVTAPRPAST